MPKAVETFTISRRVMLASGSGLLIGAAALAPLPPAPDAELIGLCAQFDALERRCNATFDACGDTREEEAQRDAVLQPLWVAQTALLERICDLKATSLQGCTARARTLALCESGEPDPEAFVTWIDRQRAALMRDLQAAA